MTLAAFKDSLNKNKPAEGLPPLLQAMWHDVKGDWNAAHDLAQDIDTKKGAWVHAFLHRKEGDGSNAAYWYDRAGKKYSTKSLSEEWEEIVNSLL